MVLVQWSTHKYDIGRLGGGHNTYNQKNILVAWLVWGVNYESIDL